MSAGGFAVLVTVIPSFKYKAVMISGRDDLRPETTATFYRIYGKVHSFRPVPEMRKD